MAEDQITKKEITITFAKSRDYRIIAVTGAWGGMNPQGEVFVDLFIDRPTSPTSITILAEKGKPSKEIKRTGAESIREAQIGLVLRPDIAHSIGTWLIDKARAAGFKETKSEGNKKDYVS